MNDVLQQNVLTNIKELTALKLWDVEAIKVNFKNPFKLVSGKLSPIYINCRLMISDPEFVSLFNAFSQITLKGIDYDIVAGGETAGIPLASFLASHLSLPMIYVRKRKKEHGLDSLIEGRVNEGQIVLLVEDLITDAGSKLQFVNEIKSSGGIVKDILVLFDRQQGGQEALEKEQIELHSLTDLNTVLSVADNSQLLSKEEIKLIADYLEA